MNEEEKIKCSLKLEDLSNFCSKTENALVEAMTKHLQEQIDRDILIEMEFNVVKEEIEKNKSLAILFRDSKNPMINKYVKKILSNHIESDTL